MGPEGKWRIDHRDLERADSACPLGRDRPRTRAYKHGGVREHRNQLLLVRCEHARNRVAFLRIHGRGFQMAGPLHRKSGPDHSPWVDSTTILAQFPRAWFFNHPPDLPSRRNTRTLRDLTHPPFGLLATLQAAEDLQMVAGGAGAGSPFPPGEGTGADDFPPIYRVLRCSTLFGFIAILRGHESDRRALRAIEAASEKRLHRLYRGRRSKFRSDTKPGQSVRRTRR